MPFLNIFNKKPVSPAIKPNPIKILIDSREKNSLVPSQLSKLNINIEFTHIPIADYLINSTAIEIKTISDLKSSIINKRIFSQLEEIKQYPNHLLIIEGNQDDLFNNEILHENALRGFLLSLAINKTPTIFTKDEKDTSLYLSLLANKKSQPISLRPNKIPFTKQQQKQFILEGFPHIGPATAKKLLSNFPSLLSIFQATEEQLQPFLKNRTKDFKDLLS